MEENSKNRVLWNEAASRGLVLGGFSAVCFALKQLSASGSEQVFTILSPIIWLLQFAGCILILRYLLRSYASKEKLSSLDSYVLGKRICTFSSLILAVVVTAVVLYIPDNFLSMQFDAMKETYSAAMDSKTKEVFDSMTMSDSPGVVFFSQFIYAYAYGSILSAILSRKIQGKEEEQTSETTDNK